jgi:hypothetical protein
VYPSEINGKKLSLTHSVRTRQVKLESVRPRGLRHPSQGLPVLLVVAAHDAGDDHAVGEVALDLGNAPEVSFLI